MVTTVMSGFDDHLLVISDLSCPPAPNIYIRLDHLPLDVVDLLPAIAAVRLEALTLLADLALWATTS